MEVIMEQSTALCAVSDPGVANPPPPPHQDPPQSVVLVAFRCVVDVDATISFP